jgi:lysozyme
MMKTSDNGRAFIEAFEGKFLHTYDDGTGVITIGYGHTNLAGVPPKVYRGQVITEAQADEILGADLAAVERNVARCIKVPLSQPEFDALVSFDFNTGDLGKSSIDDKINAGNSNAAMSTLLQYDHAGGKQMDGLTRRRKAERLMFMGLVSQALRLAGAHGATPEKPMPQNPTRPPVVVPIPPIDLPDVHPPEPKPVAKPTGWAAFFAFIASFFKRK